MEPTADTTAVPRSMDGLYAVARACLLPRGRRLRGRTWDVEDILHDTVIVAHRKVDRFVPAPGLPPHLALQGWLVGIAERLAAKRRLRCDESRVRLENRDDTPDPAPDPETHAADAERRRLVLGALGRIRPERAEALILHACDDLPSSAVARALGVNANTVKSRIRRGYHDLHAALAHADLARGARRQRDLCAAGGVPLPATERTDLAPHDQLQA